jgi:hypothetical protein
MTRLCVVEGCGKPVKGVGYCANHYYRFHKYGDPMGGGTSPGDPMKFIQEVVLHHTGDDCLTWPYAKRRDGFGTVKVGKKLLTVSRYVCELVHGEPPTIEHQAAHSCGKGHEACISPVHLRWATRVENESDKLKHGTRYRGERHWQAKLTPDQVKWVRSQRGLKTNKEMADRFGVAPSAISVILSGKSWTSV